jgi:hypothetical protein
MQRSVGIPKRTYRGLTVVAPHEHSSLQTKA